MSLVEHARRELELVGEEEEYIVGIENVVRAFADMGHSGSSAMHFIPILDKLLRFQNLTPLTDDPSQWMEISDEITIWQSRRNPEAFSEDGGKTYTLMSRPSITFKSKNHKET